MAAEFETDELIDLRMFMGYPQPVGDMPLSDAHTRLEARLEALDADYADALRNSFLTPLRDMRTALNLSHTNMKFAEIDDAYKRNSNEVDDRIALMSNLRMGLCSFVGVPAGPALAPAPSFVVAWSVR